MAPQIIDPDFRRWWRLMESLPARLDTVTRWKDGAGAPTGGEGHLHATPTLVVCLEGVVRITAPGRSVDLLPNHALIIAAGVWHSHDPLRGMSSWFGQGFIPTRSDILIGNRQREWRGGLPEEPCRRLMDRVLVADDDPRRERCRELIDQVLRESIVDLAFMHPPVQRMVERLWASLHRGVTVRDLVRASGLSRPHAYRLFTSEYGVTPKKAIETARLWLADGLLRNGLPIAQVAERCGYPSAITFSRAFKRTRGTSPSRSTRSDDPPSRPLRAS